jgi:hypothetical protein
LRHVARWFLTSAMKMEATSSSETSVDFLRTTRLYRTLLYVLIFHVCQNRLNNSVKPTAFWLEMFCVSCEVGTDI